MLSSSRASDTCINIRRFDSWRTRWRRSFSTIHTSIKDTMYIFLYVSLILFKKLWITWTLIGIWFTSFTRLSSLLIWCNLLPCVGLWVLVSNLSHNYVSFVHLWFSPFTIKDVQFTILIFDFLRKVYTQINIMLSSYYFHIHGNFIVI